VEKVVGAPVTPVRQLHHQNHNHHYVDSSCTTKRGGEERGDSDVIIEDNVNDVIEGDGSEESDASCHEPLNEVEEGVKMVSSDSIRNIRKGGNSYSFNFNDQRNNSAVAHKSYLPNINNAAEPTTPSGGGKSQPRFGGDGGFVPENTYHYGHSPSSSLPRQVGVIKPITRDDIDNAAFNEDKNMAIAIEDEKDSCLAPPPLKARATSAAAAPPPPPLPPNNKELGGGATANNNKFQQVPSSPPTAAALQQTKVLNGLNNENNKGLVVSATPAMANSLSSSSASSSLSSATSSSSSSDEEPEVGVAPPSPAVELKTVHFKREDCEVISKDEAPKSAVKKVYNFGMQLNASGDSSSKSQQDSQQNKSKDSQQNNNSNNFRDNLKSQRNKKKVDQTQQHTMVFNFVNSSRDVTHIENDGLDLSKRGGSKKSHIKQLAKEPGVILLDPVGASGTDPDEDGGEIGEDEDSDLDDGLACSRSAEEVAGGGGASIQLKCNFVFIGDNVTTGKSSLRSKPRANKKLTVSFSESLTEEFEFPAAAAVSHSNNTNSAMAEEEEEEVSSPSSTTDLVLQKTTSAHSILNAKNNTVGNFGGLGSYTPSKISDTPFQLGVSRTTPLSSSSSSGGAASAAATADRKRKPKSAATDGTTEQVKSRQNNSSEQQQVLRPTDDAVSWSGSSSSSDILF